MEKEFSKNCMIEIRRGNKSDVDLLENIETIIHKDGAIIIRNLIDNEFVQELKANLMECIHEDEKRFGREYIFIGMVHALMVRRKSFRSVLEDEFVHKIMQQILGHGTITHAFNSSSIPPGDTNYAGKLHVDSPRLIPEYITNMVLTIALDPFHKENGAMEIWPGSFDQTTVPSEDDFMSNMVRLDTLQSGDAILFNARCWHRGGINKTKDWKHAIALTACRPYMRQQFDFPKMFDEKEEADFSEELKQFMGYYVRTPKNIEEFLLSPEKRLYRSGQE